MAIGKGLCTDEDVRVGQPYLAKVNGERYLVIVPFCSKGTTRPTIPYREAAYIDPLDKELILFTATFPDLAPIY